MYLDAQRAQRGHDFFIEIGGRTGRERDRRGLGIRRANHKLVIDEVEFHFEMAVAIRHHRRIEPARTEIERHVPPMVDQRRQFEADLSHDLRPHVECGVGVLPIREADCWPAFRGVRDSSGGWLRHRSLQVIRIAFLHARFILRGKENICMSILRRQPARLQLSVTQTQRVSDHGDRTKAHGRGGEDWAQENAEERI